MESKSKRIVGGLLIFCAIILLVVGTVASFYLNCHQVIWGLFFMLAGLIFLWGITLYRVGRSEEKDKG